MSDDLTCTGCGEYAGSPIADRIEELEAKLAKAVKTLRELIGHTHNCEKELTEELHNADFCGESLPLTSARTTLAELSSVSCANLKGQSDD